MLCGKLTLDVKVELWDDQLVEHALTSGVVTLALRLSLLWPARPTLFSRPGFPGNGGCQVSTLSVLYMLWTQRNWKS